MALLASKLSNPYEIHIYYLGDKEMKNVHQTIVDNEANAVASTQPLTDEERTAKYGSFTECYYCGKYMLKSQAQCLKCFEVQPK